MQVGKLRIKCDSRLLVGQINGSCETKEIRMKEYKAAALELLGNFQMYEILQIPRAQNQEADILSKVGSDTPEYISKIARVEELSTPSIQQTLIHQVQSIPRDWTTDLKEYIDNGQLPQSEVEARLVKLRPTPSLMACCTKGPITHAPTLPQHQ
ncbi:unnamed protein product [Cuscuta europaea]|uniref:RNase H type-1 domain-containing protein n=1 Tax=Cuscuta europaea TaxID=41803 RepID=A0A9P0Z8W6_CUSEU|nr:unnamed protein product [Cuscuta europaea]